MNGKNIPKDNKSFTLRIGLGLVAWISPAVIVIALGVYLLSPGLIYGFLGLTPFSEHRASSIDLQLRMEGMIPESSVLLFGDSIGSSVFTGALSSRTVNFSLPGETSARLLSRLHEYRSLASARVIVIEVGINDILEGEERETVGNFKNLFNLIPESTEIIVCAVLPFDSTVNTRVTKKQVGELNSALNSLCSSDSRCRFYNSVPSLTISSGDLNPAAHIGDGIHLNQMGLGIWSSGLSKMLGH